MAVSARKTGINVSVFSLGGDSYLCDLEDATLTITSQTEDARGVCDEDSYAWAISRGWELQASIFVASTASLMADVAEGDGQVTVSFNTGANTYTGTGLITNASHSVSKGGLQKMSVTISGQGGLEVS